MTEWNVFEVFVAITAAFLTIGVPIIKLVAVMTRLTIVVEDIQREFDSVTTRNSDSHRRLWAKNEQQDKVLQDHDNRLEHLEGRVSAYHEHPIHDSRSTTRTGS